MEPILKLEHIQKYYGNEGNLTKAIQDISFSVAEGEFLGIMYIKELTWEEVAEILGITVHSSMNLIGRAIVLSLIHILHSRVRRMNKGGSTKRGSCQDRTAIRFVQVGSHAGHVTQVVTYLSLIHIF